MPSARSRVFRSVIVEHLIRNVTSLEGRTIDEYRRKEEALAGHQILPRGTRVERLSIAGLSAEWVRAKDVPVGDACTILYFHGGGYIAGSCSTHRDLAARISAACGVRALVVEYRLAPEHKYPAAFDDGLSSYRWLQEHGVAARQIAIGGDSAGGGLALATLLALRDGGEELPKAAFLLSPWLSQIPDGESYKTRAEVDPLISEDFAAACAKAFLGGTGVDARDLVLFEKDLQGLPSLLVQVGEDEILLSDSVRLVENARAAGVDARLDVWKEMWHVFQAFAIVMPEAKHAVAAIGSFVREKLDEPRQRG
ncbi:MAG: alpha/beta hydrolase [Gaiellaceae bacterium]